jgi:hypothetical protein
MNSEAVQIGKYQIPQIAIAFIAVSLYAGIASAITAPASTAFAYDVYDVGVNSVLKGPIGFIGGVGAIVFGAVTAIRGAILQALPALLGGGVLLKADTIVTTLGVCI